MRVLLALLLLPMMAMASPPPPVPEGLVTTGTMDCVDRESGQRGFCISFVDASGQRWMGFYQQGEIAMIRTIAPDGSYETTWMATWFNTF